MEQLIFFILGVVTVLLIIGVVVAVRMVQKNNKMEGELTSLKEVMEDNISELRRHVEDLDKLVNLRVDREIDSVNRNFDDVYRTIDSRLDKLSARIDNDLKDIHQEFSQINNKLN